MAGSPYRFAFDEVIRVVTVNPDLAPIDGERGVVLGRAQNESGPRRRVTVLLSVLLVTAFVCLEATHFVWYSLKDTRYGDGLHYSTTEAEARRFDTLVRTYTPSVREVALSDGSRVLLKRAFVEREHRLRPVRYFRTRVVEVPSYSRSLDYDWQPRGALEDPLPFAIEAPSGERGRSLVAVPDELRYVVRDVRTGTETVVVFR